MTSEAETTTNALLIDRLTNKLETTERYLRDELASHKLTLRELKHARKVAGQWEARAETLAAKLDWRTAPDDDTTTTADLVADIAAGLSPRDGEPQPDRATVYRAHEALRQLCERFNALFPQEATK